MSQAVGAFRKALNHITNTRGDLFKSVHRNMLYTQLRLYGEQRKYAELVNLIKSYKGDDQFVGELGKILN